MGDFEILARRRSSAIDRGLTTIELMIVLAIVALLAGVALPGFGALLQRARIARAGDELGAAIYLARAEALRRGGNVRLRKAATEGCLAADAKDWSCGWRVDAVEADARADDEPELIQSWAAPRGVQVTVNAAGAGGLLSINRWGRFNNLGAFSFELKPAGDAKSAVPLLLCMSSAGRLQTAGVKGAC
jgi:type IV fimbrial biogenesis protein FimT